MYVTSNPEQMANQIKCTEKMERPDSVVGVTTVVSDCSHDQEWAMNIKRITVSGLGLVLDVLRYLENEVGVSMKPGACPERLG